MTVIRKSITGLNPDSDYIFTLKAKNVEVAATDDEQDVIRVTMPTFDGTPSIITGLQLASNFQNVIFKFNPINDKDLSYFEYQLYDNESGSGDPINAFNSISNDPVLISGTNGANVFLVSVENSTQSIDPTTQVVTTDTKKYWGRVRAVNISGNPSTQWSDLVATGDLELIQDSFIANLTAAKITAGTIGAAEIVLAGATSIIKSSNYSAGTSGWQITGFGDAEFNDLTVRTSLDIGGDDTTSFHVDANGNMWSGAGILNLSTAPFRVTNAGTLTATNANITGVINATSGTFAGRVRGGDLYIGGASEAAAPFKVDSSGNLTATSANITGTISGSTISGGSININNGVFQVSSTGALTATSATITGTISSGSTISGATISGGTITIGSNPGFRVNATGDLDAGQGEFNFTSGQATLRVRRSFSGNTNKRLVIFRNNDGGGVDVADIEFTSSSSADFFPASDIRLKNVLNETINATEIIKKIEPKVFTWKNDDDNNKFYGFIAQQIYEHIPHAVNVGEDDEDGNMLISWKVSGNQVVPYLVKAVQELSAKVDELESKMIS